MKIDELLEKRAAAGERYAAATGELHTALIELAALDAVLASDTSGHFERPVRTFFDVPQNLANLAHPKFAPADMTTCWRDQIAARRDELLAKFEVAK
jgi:hypothetical protein